MKVLWFTNTPCNGVVYMKEQTIGGGWLQSLDIQMQEKVDLHIAFYGNLKNGERQFVTGRTTYYPIPSNNLRWSSMRNIFYPHIIDLEDTGSFLEIIKRVSPDVIHIHGTENPFGSIISKVNIPVLVSIQGIISPYAVKFPGTYSEKSLSQRDKTPGGVKNWMFTSDENHKWKLMQMMAKREARHMKQTRYLMGRTTWDRQVSSVLAPHSTYFHGDEIMRDSFYHLTWKPRQDRTKFIIHTTSSNAPYKGFNTLCMAVKILTDIGIDIEWRVAGMKESDAVFLMAKAEMKSEFPKTGLVLLGKLPSEQLVEKMMEADLFVLPSVIENSPNSLCEAMLMEMPCVATNGGGIPSMLKDGEEGLLTHPGDPWALAGMVKETIENYDKALTMASKARQTARQRHDPQRIVNQVMTAYESILSSQ